MNRIRHVIRIIFVLLLDRNSVEAKAAEIAFTYWKQVERACKLDVEKISDYSA